MLWRAECNCKPRLLYRCSRKLYERLIPGAKAYECRRCGHRVLEIKLPFRPAAVASKSESGDPDAPK
jgi:DNA-directed RNA polymerase subunit RPC12/RpoP